MRKVSDYRPPSGKSHFKSYYFRSLLSNFTSFFTHFRPLYKCMKPSFISGTPTPSIFEMFISCFEEPLRAEYESTPRILTDNSK